MKHKSHFTLPILVLVATLGSSGCSSMRSVLALDGPGSERPAPIHNPFGKYYSGTQDHSENIVLRTKKGDRSIEVELPGKQGDMTDFVIPVNPAFAATKEGTRSYGRAPASVSSDSGNTDYTDGADYNAYKDRKPSWTDREIVANMPKNLVEDDGKRREIEQGLGLVPAGDELADNQNSSYLASLDNVKHLYKGARYEAALLEIDEMLKVYQTDSKLYEMRGTLLDRLGKTDLAVKSWNQALRFDPANKSLKRFVERRQMNRKVAGQ